MDRAIPAIAFHANQWASQVGDKTISYWPDVDVMASFTGSDPHMVHHLPRDAEFLIELPERVAVTRILVDQPPRT